MSDSLRWFTLLLISGSPDASRTVKLLLCITAMLLIVTAITRFWPRTSAAQRHLLWSAACGGILLAPLLQWLVPSYELRVLPVIEQVPTRAPTSSTLAVTPSAVRLIAKTPVGDVFPATAHAPAPAAPCMPPTCWI